MKRALLSIGGTVVGLVALLGRTLVEVVDLQDGVLEKLLLDHRLELRHRHSEDVQPLVDLG